MKLRLQTYTPVHIGSGNSLSSMDYVIDGTHYYRVTTTQFVDFLLSYNPPLVDLFSDWIIEQASLMEDLKYRRKDKEINRREKTDLNQQLSRAQQETNLRSFCKIHELESHFIKYLKSKAENGEIVMYQLQSKRLNYNKGQVQEILSNSKRQFYIPGSSIKGAIRTALLFHAYMTHALDIPDPNDNSDPYKERLEVGLDLELEDAIKEISKLNDRNRKRSKRREIAGYIGQDLEPLMSYGITINEKGQKERRDVQQDVFKFLLISDAIPRTKSPAISVIKVDRYLLEKNRKSGLLEASIQKQTPHIEAIDKSNIFDFSLSVSVREMFEIYKVLKNQNRKIWIQMEHKVKQIFGIDLSVITENNLKSIQEKAEKRILKVINNFAQQQIAFDKLWLENFLSTNSFSQSFPRNLSHEKTFNQAFKDLFSYNFQSAQSLLRLGYGGGFHNKTLLIYFLKEPKLKSILKRILEELEVGKVSKPHIPYHINMDRFPKSRTLITHSHDVSPIGWVEVGLEETWKKLPKNQEEKPEKASSKQIKAVFLKKTPKKGDIIDGVYLRKGHGRQKIFLLYLTKGITQERGTNYFADLEESRVYQLQVSAIDKKTGKIQSFTFKKPKS